MRHTMFNMAPAFTTCLIFSCFFLERWSLVSLQKTWPKPTLRITSGSVTVRRGNLTLSCAAGAPYRDMTFVLYGGGYSIPTQDPPGTEAVFHFTDVNSGHEGSYYCLYYSKGTDRIESEHSDTVRVTLQEVFPKPSVVLSSSVVARGGNLTIRCTSEYLNMRFFLYRKGTSRCQVDPRGSEAVFVISGVQQTDEGPYECRYHPRYGVPVWADAEPFNVRVQDLSKPSISYEPVRTVEGDYKIACSALQDKTVKRFFLFRNRENAPLTDRTPSPGSQSVTFPVSGVNARAGTEYRCSYQIQESGESVESPVSDPVQIGKDNQQETSKATTPRNDGQTPSVEPTESRGMDDTLIIAVVCAVLLVVILVVAFILYIKCKPKKANGDIQKRNLPLNEEKKTDSLEPMYAIVTKVKTSNNTITPEVKKQEEGGYDEGLTYAVINKDALKNKKKNSAPPFQEPEPTLYASVNIH